MRRIKAFALMATIAVVGASLGACGGGSTAEETTVKQQEAADAQDDAADDMAEVDDTEDMEQADTVADEGSDMVDQLKQILTIGYVGTDEDGNTIYWAVDDNVSSGLLLVDPADGSEQISYVGDILSEEGSDKLTLTDDKTGNAIELTTEQITDDEGNPALMFTTESGFKSVLVPAPVDKVIDAMFSVAK